MSLLVILAIFVQDFIDISLVFFRRLNRNQTDKRSTSFVMMVSFILYPFLLKLYWNRFSILSYNLFSCTSKQLFTLRLSVSTSTLSLSGPIWIGVIKMSSTATHNPPVTTNHMALPDSWLRYLRDVQNYIARNIFILYHLPKEKKNNYFVNYLNAT